MRLSLVYFLAILFVFVSGEAEEDVQGYEDPIVNQLRHIYETKKSIFISTGYGPGGINSGKTKPSVKNTKALKLLKQEIDDLRRRYEDNDSDIPTEALETLKKKIMKLVEQMKSS